MKFAVLTYANASNPDGVPGDWPHTARIVGDADAVIYPELEMTPAAYDAYVATHQAAYDAWEYQHELNDKTTAAFEALWKSAYDYNFQFFSGGAYAQILELKLAGVPKALAVQNWILALWTDYYTRKYMLGLATTFEAVDAVSLDFTNNGAPPHTVPEMLAEAAALGIGG